MKRWRGKQAYHVDSERAKLTIYTPGMSRGRERQELGFLLRLMDPRVRPVGVWPSGSPRWQRGRHRWRWLKVWACWTNPALCDHRGRVGAIEIETHLTDGKGTRMSTKSYVRFKIARGAPRDS